MTVQPINATRRPMSAAAFRKWCKRMNLSKRQAAAALGVSYGAFLRCQQDGAPLHIALACAALLSNLGPYGINLGDLNKFKTDTLNGQPVPLDRRKQNGTAEKLQVA